MRVYKILYLEHDEKRGGETARAMRAAKKACTGDVTIEVEAPSFESTSQYLTAIRNYLMNNHVDAVITDAFFPLSRAGTASVEENVFLLPDIIKVIGEAKVRQPILGVLTRYSSRIMENEAYFQALSAADFLWGKQSVRLAFWGWQLPRLIELIGRRHPHRSLIYWLLDALKTREELPWREHMTAMLERYLEGTGTGDQIKGVFRHVLDIAAKIGCEREIKRLFGLSRKSEPLNVAGKPEAWGHLRHILNVYWLGYYLLNVGFLDCVKVGRLISGGDDSLSREACIDVANRAWYVTALSHDVGYLGQIYLRILNDVNALLDVYPDGVLRKSKLCVEEGDSLNDAMVGHVTSLLKTVWDDKLRHDLAEWLKNIAASSETEVDHGLLSAITVGAELGNHLDANVLRQVALAVALHNNAGPPQRSGAPTMPMLEFEESPMACLLIFCDQIQAWDRETDLQESKIESVELAELHRQPNQNELYMRINYYPFRGELGSLEEIKQNLKNEVLGNKVFDTLHNSRIGTGSMPHVKIDFYIGGESKRWESRQ